MVSATPSRSLVREEREGGVGGVTLPLRRHGQPRPAVCGHDPVAPPPAARSNSAITVVVADHRIVFRFPSFGVCIAVVLIRVGRWASAREENADALTNYLVLRLRRPLNKRPHTDSARTHGHIAPRTQSQPNQSLIPSVRSSIRPSVIPPVDSW